MGDHDEKSPHPPLHTPYPHTTTTEHFHELLVRPVVLIGVIDDCKRGNTSREGAAKGGRGAAGQRRKTVKGQLCLYIAIDSHHVSYRSPSRP